jgi:hypothetical protein
MHGKIGVIMNMNIIDIPKELLWQAAACDNVGVTIL